MSEGLMNMTMAEQRIAELEAELELTQEKYLGVCDELEIVQPIIAELEAERANGRKSSQPDLSRRNRAII